MSGFPLAINADTFSKSFLNGDGNFEITTSQNIWKDLFENNQPFTNDVTNIATLNFGTTTSKAFQFGEAGSVKLTVGLTTGMVGTIQLVWPDNPNNPNEILKFYDLLSFLAPGHLYVIVHFEAKSDVSANASFPVGPLSGTIGIAAGGNVGYDRLMLYNSFLSARQVLMDVFAGIRLPSKVRTVAELPASGEVLAIRYGGYLKLSAGLSWGYSLTGSQSFGVQDLQLTLDYALQIKAALSVGYRLAGDFHLEARRGTMDGWVRFVVRKSRESEFNFAFDFGLTADLNLKGLPDSANDFLGALLGTDVKTVLGYFAQVEELTSLDKLEEKVGGLVKGWLSDLSHTLLDQVLENTNLKQFLEKMEQVVRLYQTIDQRLISIYTAYLGKLPNLTEALLALERVIHRTDLQNLENVDAWEIIKQVVGENLYDLLLDDSIFGELKKFVTTLDSFVNDAGTAEIRQVIALIKQKLNLDHLFNNLAQFDTPAKLQALADEQLQALVGRLVGKAFKEIKASEFGKVFADIHAVLTKIQDFQTKWYETLTKAVHQTFSFNLHFAYSRAKHNETLLDVELNLNDPNGQALAEKAASGDFAEVVEGFHAAFVKINQGVLTHSITKQTAIQINVLGWSFNRVVEVIQKATTAVEVENGSLINVYTLDTQITERKEQGKKFKETVHSNFLMQMVGEIAKATPNKEYVLDVLRNMSARYELVQADDLTSEDELFAYLEFGEFLGLIHDRRRLLEQLKVEFPQGFGKVKLDYVVRYDPSTFQHAFTLSGRELKSLARQTMRHLIGTKYIGMPSTNWQRVLGFAYQSPYFSQKYAEGFTALRADRSEINLPSWLARNGPRRLSLRPQDRESLITLFNVEKAYLERLDKLDRLVDQALVSRKSIPVNELQKAAREFVEMADDLGQFRENAFFAILDKLIQAGSSGKGRRESAMLLEITPPLGETVIKTLMA